MDLRSVWALVYGGAAALVIAGVLVVTGRFGELLLLAGLVAIAGWWLFLRGR
jgi:hypothetical protein